MDYEQSETNDVEVDEIAAEPEEFQDITMPTFESEVTPAASSQVRPASCIMSVPALPATPITSPSIICEPSISQLHVFPVCGVSWFNKFPTSSVQANPFSCRTLLVGLKYL